MAAGSGDPSHVVISRLTSEGHSTCEATSDGVQGTTVSQQQTANCQAGAIGAWLAFLQMPEEYLQGFIDNGYDDFETVKRMGGEDLLAVGVTDLQHQTFILEAVRVLREKGAVWVYLLDTGLSASMSDSLHAEYNNCQQPKSSDLEGAASLTSPSPSRVAPGITSCVGSTTTTTNVINVTPERHSQPSKRPKGGEGGQTKSTLKTSTTNQNKFKQNSLISQPLTHDPDEIQKATPIIASLPTSSDSTSSTGSSNSFYTSGKPRLCSSSAVNGSNQLCSYLADRLAADKIDLAAPPFSSKAGDGYLVGLAQKYACDLRGGSAAISQDEILHQLEVLRRSEFKSQVRQKYSNKQSSHSNSRKSATSDEESSNNSTYQEVVDAFGQLLGGSGQQQPQEIRNNQHPISPQQQLPYNLLNHHGQQRHLHSSAESTSEDSEVIQRLLSNQLPHQPPYSPHTYANFPSGSHTRGHKQSSYSPGTYASSSCLSDRDEDDIYDFAAKYEGKSFIGKPKITSPGWFRTARRLINKNSSKDDLSLGSPSFGGGRMKTGPSPVQFSTRTRLRPGGPTAPNLRSPLVMGHSTMRSNGSLPSVTATEGFEEIAMRTMSTRNSQPGGPAYWDHQVMSPQGPSGYPYLNKSFTPATPLVKQRTAGCASPRVQMYKTRVFYSGTENSKPDHQLMPGGMSTFNIGSKDIPEAAV